METQYTQPNQNKMVYLILSHVRQKWEILAFVWMVETLSLITQIPSLITHYSITHHLSLKNPQGTPQACLALQPG